MIAKLILLLSVSIAILARQTRYKRELKSMAKDLQETADNGKLLLEDSGEGYNKGFKSFKSESIIQPPALEISPKCAVCKTINQYFINKMDWLVEKSQFHRQDEALLEFCDSVDKKNVVLNGNCHEYAKKIATLKPYWEKQLTAYQICYELKDCKQTEESKFKFSTSDPKFKGLAASFKRTFLHAAKKLAKSAVCTLCEQAVNMLVKKLKEAKKGELGIKTVVNTVCSGANWIKFATVISICNRLTEEAKKPEPEGGELVTKMMAGTNVCKDTLDSCRDAPPAKAVENGK